MTDSNVDGVTILPNNGLQVPSSATTFPAVCCRCLGETTTIRPVQFEIRHMWWFPSRMRGTLEMPVCNPCWKKSWLSLLMYASVTEVIWFVGLTLLIFGTESKSTTVYGTMAAIALVPTLFTLSFLPKLWTNPAEVLQNFASKEFRFRFADPKYSDLMLAAIRARDQRK